MYIIKNPGARYSWHNSMNSFQENHLIENLFEVVVQ